MLVTRTTEDTSPKNVFAADLGGTKISAAAVSRRGKIVARVTERVDTASKSAPVFQIARLAEQLARPRRVDEAFEAGAVAVPGLVRRTGTVWAPNLPGWESMPLRTRLERALKIPFAIESDRNAAAVGETWLGAARGKSDAVMLVLGTGIGAGIISGGKVIRGAHELSGCAGWIVVNDWYTNEVRHVGQLEAFAAGPGIARAAAARIKAGTSGALGMYGAEDVTSRDVAEAARDGDPEALAIFEEAGKMLGRAVANIISMFDPEVIILGGGMAGAVDLFMPSLNAVAREWAQPLASRQVKIKRSQLLGDANLLGAARLAWGLVTAKEREEKSGRAARA
ncbi:MAG TPA: ROK family protein [Terriglobales bacterium]|nr:ROK family protein [Terriglobales bacterium]